jgi:general secretion pathway protein I
MHFRRVPGIRGWGLEQKKPEARGWRLALLKRSRVRYAHEEKPVSQQMCVQCPFPLVPSPQPPTPTNGFTLLEVLVAMAVLSVALVGLLGLYNRSLLLTGHTQRLSTATLLAQEMLNRTTVEGVEAARVNTGDFAELYPGQYPEFRWYRTVRATPLEGLWEIRVGVSWGERADEACELTVFTPLKQE